MANRHAIQQNRRFAGALLMIPSVQFVTANFLKYQVGLTQPYEVLSPAWSTDIAAYQAAFNSVVLLGPLVGLALVAWSVIRLSFSRRDGG
jgi:hypothetical protein